MVLDLLDELESAGVFLRDGNGAIYSRRMVADEGLRAKASAAGRLGGNPDLKGRDKPTPGAAVKGTLKGVVKGGDIPSEIRDQRSD
ncbi:hypothetical protein [Gemmata obscuriglobus]|uniref:Uncharacterized protein n=1 Tax=Gemmata obscuriglobus TaxID=114 RepID=A0A2Z3H0H1_9BACT|nr:hypothetical protein [Gemmata obscuriglobus]AWM40269.1 hypothetical protein C1280_26880 [Gemmata obscuriglobus]